MRKRIEEIADEIGEPIILIDDLDDAIVGTHVNEHGNVVAVYDRTKCIECLAKSFAEDCDESDDLVEMAEDNTERSLPSLHEQAPIIVDLFCNTAT